MRICFLAHSIYSLGGTTAAMLNTASALLDRGHDIEIIPVFRKKIEPIFPTDHRIRVTPLVDTSGAADSTAFTAEEQRAHQSPSAIVPATETTYRQYSKLADRRVREFLADCRPDILVANRPGLIKYMSLWAPAEVATVAQEHTFYGHHSPAMIAELHTAYRRTDALVTVSGSDADMHRRAMPDIADKIHFIPNSVVDHGLCNPSFETKSIIAAGRLEPVKRYDVLIRAFAEVHRCRPDWRLDIYGHGSEESRLQRLIDELGLKEAATLRGTRTPMDEVWRTAAIAAVSSDAESFGLTLVEAMLAGLPVVSTACDFGPREIIDHEVNGLLTPPGSPDALADVLLRLIAEPETWARMSKAARRKAEGYDTRLVSQQHEQLFEKILAERQARPRFVG